MQMGVLWTCTHHFFSTFFFNFLIQQNIASSSSNLPAGALESVISCREPVWGTPPMAKVMRKAALAYAKADRASGNPIPEHLPPKPESTYFTVSCSHLYLWLDGGMTPITSLGEGVNLQLQVNKNSWAWQECFNLNLSADRLACVTGLSILLPLCTWLFTTSQP